MNLEYTVLWFEDDDDWLAGITSLIREDLSTLGFNLRIIAAKNDEDLKSLIKRRDIDLLAIDYRLEGVKGDEILTQIRDKEILTECVFYSSTDITSLRRAVAENEIDGVYCATRNEFQQKMLGVMKTTIRKAQEINAIRGLVLSATSEFDDCMDAIVESYSSAGEAEKKRVRGKVRALLTDASKQLSATLEEFDDTEIKKVLALGVMDSYKVWRTLKDVLKPRRREEGIVELWAKVCKYSEMIEFRNKLAHVKARRNETTGEMEISDLKFKGKDFQLTDLQCAGLRNELQDHGKNFEAIKRIICGE